ncbi:MAG: 3-deoxy-D-manno-octulosonic acid transferase [Verrucomicrobia bacterium]|nr:3-deoxy-D-manno-octulosonic acid transferase [Verrucomicrobiota bacterium]
MKFSWVRRAAAVLRMRRIYNTLFTIFFVVSLPYYFLKMWRRGNWKQGLSQRFGRHSTKLKQAITNRHVLWMHAVSVGEVNICTQLIRALEPRVPNLKIVVSTTTSTGMAELQKKLPHHIEKIYYPIDYRKCVERALRTIGPEAVVLVEAEIWPNFLWRIADKSIPVFLVNARMSERSYRGYKRFASLFQPIFRSFTGVGVQNETDAQRLVALGCRPEAVHVVGNLKFDAARVDERPLFNIAVFLKQLGVREGARIVVGGSTHAGEEALLADLFLRLRKTFPDMFLILVPRHFERGKEVGQQLSDRRIKFAYRTEVGATTQFKPGELECLLVNTTGELKYFYEPASVIFVGKSLTAEGGQNPIEPGALGKAMIFGPNMQSFSSIAAAFVSRGGAVQVQNAAELEQACDELLRNEHRRVELGRNALKVVNENLGSIQRTVEMIVTHLHGEEVYVAPAPEQRSPLAKPD